MTLERVTDGVMNVLRNITEAPVRVLGLSQAEARARGRVLMFDQGKVVEDAAPEQLFTEPRHTRTREFLHAVLDRS